MSEESASPAEEPTPKPEPIATPAPVDDDKQSGPPKSIFLVSYPKIVFLYPAWIASIAAGIYSAIASEQRGDTQLLALGFLVLLAINLVVLSFDFPRTTSLTLFALLVAVGIGLWFLFSSYPDIVPFVSGFIANLKPFANAAFYFIFAGFMGLVYVGVAISVKFDYWEIRPNELLHHHGFLSDLKRYSAPNLRIDKEINDVFEYLLLRSGRLILHPSQERRAIVLENVFFINHKEQAITKMLGSLQVRVRKDSEF